MSDLPTFIDAGAVRLAIAKGRLCPECARREPAPRRTFCTACTSEYVSGIHRMRKA
jgi:hypothetical protein